MANQLGISRRDVLQGGLALAVAGIGVGRARAQTARTAMRVYIGTYTSEDGSKGIYRFSYDPQSGAMTPEGLMAETKNPTFLSFHPRGDYLYSVSEIGQLDGKKTGGVSAYQVDPATGNLTLLNQRASQGAGPCHVQVHPTGKLVLAANYSGGSVAALPIGRDGSLGEATGFQQHAGNGADPKRQAGPHAHSFFIDPSGRFGLCCDLGLDQVLVYRLDLNAGTIAANDPPHSRIHPGAGPRHLAFHPNGQWVFVINELDSTMTVLEWHAASGVLTAIETQPTLPDGWEGTNWPADVHVHPNGRWLYGSNRGHDSLVIYGIDQATGKLTLVGHESTRGGHPRNFTFDPAGKRILVANRDNDNIVVFDVDPDTGLLKHTGVEATCGKPVCVCFAPGV
jgi:6-phosphogluconolactonase